MERYQYKECGLDNIWLINGFSFVETEDGKGVSISGIRQLNKAIGLALTELSRPLKPREFRFLRVEMDLSQKKISDLFFVEPQTVGRWERGETAIPGTADVLIRLYFKDYFNEHPQVKAFLEKLAELDTTVDEEVNLEKTPEGWKRAA
ncbi:MAG: transcriptional regulator [Alphaproteobacteria bacterium]|nr:transcriptional regulator [Alphaproteobacteria bacterium]